jgi:hypothetical protein
MDSPEYIYLIFDNLIEYLLSLLIVASIYLMVFKKYYLSILDPFLIPVVFSAFSSTTVVFLFWIDEVSPYYYWQFVLTQSAFFLGFRIFSPIRLHRFAESEQVLSALQVRTIKWMFLLCMLLVLPLQLFSYVQKGIPLLSESRLDVYSEIDSLKFVKRILETLIPLFTLLTSYFFFHNTKGIYKSLSKLSLVFLLIFAVLSGAKSSFLSIIGIFFVFALYSVKLGNGDLIVKFKQSHKFMILGVIFFASLIVFFGENSQLNPLLFLAYRIAINGDIFYMTLPNGVIENFERINILTTLFSGPLQFFGFINSSMVSEPLGFQIMKFHNPSIEFKGPNPRMNVFGYIQYGFTGSIIYALIVGMISSFLRNRLFKLLPSNILGCIVYFYLLMFASTIETDLIYSLGSVINLAFFLVPFLIACYVLALSSQFKNYA